MTLMITAGGGGLPVTGAGEAAGTDGSGGSAGKAGDAFAGVLAGIPATDSRPVDPKADRRPAADRTGKQAGDSDAEPAVIAGAADMALLAPAMPPAAMLAFRADLGAGAAAEPPAGSVDESAASTPVGGSGAFAGTLIVGTALSAPALAGTALPGAAPVSAPEFQQPTAEAAISQLQAAGADAAPKAAGTADRPAPAGDRHMPDTNRPDPGGSHGAGSAQQPGTGNGLRPVKAMGPTNAADAAQAVAAAKIFQTAGSAAPTDAGTAATSAEQVNHTRPATGGPISAGAAQASGTETMTTTAPAALNHRPAKSATGEADSRAAEPAQPAGQLPSRMPAEPASATSQPGVAAMQQVPAQPAPVGHQLPVTGGHGPQRAHFQPPSTPETPLARQVAGPLLALRAGGDASHQLIVALHPVELGPVNVHVRIEGDLMTIQLASNNETAHDTLRDALPQLRSELQSAGLGGVALSLDMASGGAPGSGAFADPRQAAGDPGRPARAAPVSEPIPASPRHRTSGDRISIHSSSGLDRWL